MTWTVWHDQAGIEYGRHKTKKAATAAAKEMEAAHSDIEALHDGEPVTFSVEKRQDEEPPAEEPET